MAAAWHPPTMQVIPSNISPTNERGQALIAAGWVFFPKAETAAMLALDRNYLIDRGDGLPREMTTGEKTSHDATKLAEQVAEVAAVALRDREEFLKRKYIRHSSLLVLRGTDDAASLEELKRIVAGADYRTRTGL